MTHQYLTTISRKARIWPEIPGETIDVPSPPMIPAPPQATMLTTVFVSLVSMVVYGIVFTHFISGVSSLFLLPFIAISGLMAISTLVTYLAQVITQRQQASYMLTTYLQRLQETEAQLLRLHWQERQAWIDMHPPLIMPPMQSPMYTDLNIVPLVRSSFSEQDARLWARRPDDPDFLTVRIGMERRRASYQVRSYALENRITTPNQIDAYNNYARAMLATYTFLHVPLVVKCREHSPIALVGSEKQLEQARELMHAMVCQLAYHHSPDDVRIIILAPRSQEQAWSWAELLPHTLVYDPRRPEERENEELAPHAVALGTEAVIEHLPLISRELGRRELLLGDVQQASKAVTLPHLVIVVDYFDPLTDLDQPTQRHPIIGPVHSGEMQSVFSSLPSLPSLRRRSHLSTSPLKRPEMTLALSRGSQLGVSVLCVCEQKSDIPPTGKLMIDLNVSPLPRTLPSTPLPLQLHNTARWPFGNRGREKEAGTRAGKAGTRERSEAIVQELCPNPPAFMTCVQLDRAPHDALSYFAQRLQSLRTLSPKRLEIRTQVDLRMLFEPPLDLSDYDPHERWDDPGLRELTPALEKIALMQIPIGLKIGDEIQYLDLLRDGPHGLLIGQTGSGKSELLQTIIMAFAILYRPTEVNFLLIDYKAGLALEPFRRLPHTIGFLSNVSSPAQIQRFITMLRAEATRREIRMKEGKATPRLLIIIDEFAEMAKRTEAVLDELFTITRVGREIGMHLLLAAQRPEGIIGGKVRDYVQYRLCLRCASPEDSREVLRRVDAAYLPASIPGRGYLLHGDNQLDLFQAARVTMPVPHSLLQAAMPPERSYYEEKH